MNLKNKLTIAAVGLSLALSSPAKAANQKTNKQTKTSKAKVEEVLSNKPKLTHFSDINSGIYETLFIQEKIPELLPEELEEKNIILDSYFTKNYLQNLNKYFVSVDEEIKISKNLKAKESKKYSKEMISKKIKVQNEILDNLKKHGLIKGDNIIIKGNKSGKRLLGKIITNEEFYHLFLNSYYEEDDSYDKDIYQSDILIKLEKNKKKKLAINDFKIIKGDQKNVKFVDGKTDLKSDLIVLSSEINDVLESIETEENVNEEQKKEAINYLETKLIETLKKYPKEEEMLIFGYNFYKEIKPVESKRIGYLKMMWLLGIGEDLIEEEIIEPYSRKIIKDGVNSLNKDEIKVLKTFEGFFQKYLKEELELTKNSKEKRSIMNAIQYFQ